MSNLETHMAEQDAITRAYESQQEHRRKAALRLYIGRVSYRRKGGTEGCILFRTIAAKDQCEAERECLARFERHATGLKAFSHIISVKCYYFANQIQTK